MGSSEGGIENGGGYNKESQKKKVKPYYMMMLIFLSSLLVSIVGSFMLGWWIYKYHPTNSELWMVPFGLILFVTPLIIGLSLILSGQNFCKKEEDEEQVSDLKR